MHWPHQAQWVCAHLSGPPLLVPPRMWLAPPSKHQWCLGGHSEACLSCGEFRPRRHFFWKTAHSPGGVGIGEHSLGAAFLGVGWGRPMKNATLRLGKGCRGTHVLHSRLSEGLHRLRDPGLTVPEALLPAGCLPPTDVDQRAASWPLSAAQDQSQDPGAPELPLLSFSRSDWTLWGSSAQGHKLFASSRNEGWLCLEREAAWNPQAQRGLWTGIYLVGLLSPSGNIGVYSHGDWSARAKGPDFFPSQGSVCFSSANRLFCDSKSEKVKLGEQTRRGLETMPGLLQV